jgi:hypothetical protein
MKNKSIYPRKKNTAYKKYGNNSVEEKNDSMMVKVYVSVIMILFTLAIANLNIPEAEKLQLNLKTAISENITVEQAKQISQKGIKKLMAFKEKEMPKKVEDSVEEVFLPNDAAEAN